jgi:hypothetical protein
MASYISGWVLKFVFMTHPFEPINFISEVFLHPLIHHKVGEMVDELNFGKISGFGEFCVYSPRLFSLSTIRCSPTFNFNNPKVNLFWKFLFSLQLYPHSNL